jgi:hypothetical protein
MTHVSLAATRGSGDCLHMHNRQMRGRCELLVILRDDFRSLIQLWNEKAMIKKIFLLSQVPILAAASVPYLRHLARFCDTAVLNQGADILRSGTEPEKVYLIKKGTCLLEKSLTLVHKRAPGSLAKPADRADVARMEAALRRLPQVRSQVFRLDSKSGETVFDVSISIAEVVPCHATCTLAPQHTHTPHSQASGPTRHGCLGRSVAHVGSPSHGARLHSAVDS